MKYRRKTTANGPAIRRLTPALLGGIPEGRLPEQKPSRTQCPEAVSILAFGIAHEIDQPLSALDLYAQRVANFTG